MIDFTSSLYLGMKHASCELQKWEQLTTGKPSALFEPAESQTLGQKVAEMQGLQKGITAPSTLHLYWDLFGFLRTKKIALFIDDKVYAVSKYGIERLCGNSISIHYFQHLNANHLCDIIEKKLTKNTAPVIITDGWCPLCGKPAPIRDYVAIINEYNGLIIIDDTQAFGILGERKNEVIYGNGGGGIVKWMNIHNQNIIIVTSLAKAFGVPIAVISGNEPFIIRFSKSSETSVNSSPASNAHVRAGLNALSINAADGEERRRKLLININSLKKHLARSQIVLQGSIFPVQSISCSLNRANYLQDKLNGKGIKTVLVKGHNQPEPTLVFIIRCDHSDEEIETLSCEVERHYNYLTKRTNLVI